MSKHPKIEIKTGESGAFTEIYVDGHRLPGVRSYRLEHGSGNALPVLTVDLNALDLSVDVPVFLIRNDAMGAMEIKFNDLIKTDEFGMKKYTSIDQLSKETGIPSDKIAEFVRENGNDKFMAPEIQEP